MATFRDFSFLGNEITVTQRRVYPGRYEMHAFAAAWMRSITVTVVSCPSGWRTDDIALGASSLHAFAEGLAHLLIIRHNDREAEAADDCAIVDGCDRCPYCAAPCEEPGDPMCGDCYRARNDVRHALTNDCDGPALADGVGSCAHAGTGATKQCDACGADLWDDMECHCLDTPAASAPQGWSQALAGRRTDTGNHAARAEQLRGVAQAAAQALQDASEAGRLLRMVDARSLPDDLAAVLARFGKHAADNAQRAQLVAGLALADAADAQLAEAFELLNKAHSAGRKPTGRAMLDMRD